MANHPPFFWGAGDVCASTTWGGELLRLLWLGWMGRMGWMGLRWAPWQSDAGLGGWRWQQLGIWINNNWRYEPMEDGMLTLIEHHWTNIGRCPIFFVIRSRVDMMPHMVGWRFEWEDHQFSQGQWIMAAARAVGKEAAKLPYPRRGTAGGWFPRLPSGGTCRISWVYHLVIKCGNGKSTIYRWFSHLHLGL